MTDFTVINLLRGAVALAGDGGISPFTDEEYNAMYEFLDRQEMIERQMTTDALQNIEQVNFYHEN